MNSVHVIAAQRAGPEAGRVEFDFPPETTGGTMNKNDPGDPVAEPRSMWNHEPNVVN
jgi:hypothetical protein